MGIKGKPSPAYYFVPLGRERGSLLDLLGLLRDAGLSEVEGKQTKYRLELQQTFRQRCKALQEREGITPQELEAEVEKLKEEKTAKEQTLNELAARYEALMSEKRRLENRRKALKAELDAGRITYQEFKVKARQFEGDDDQTWIEVYRTFGDLRELWQFLLSARQIPDVPPELLDEIERTWIAAHLGGRDGAAEPRAAGGCLLSQTCSAAQPVDLRTLARLVVERDLIRLLAADALWSRLSHTNREHWSGVMERWAAEVASLGPHWRREAPGPRPAAYQGLHRPTPLTVELSSDEDAEPLRTGGRAGSGGRAGGVVFQTDEAGTSYITEEDLLALLEQLRAEEPG